ncbi:dihydrofolate reductase [Pseudobacteroides cellulosolvens]|uniref:dihydrofolate reductase n=1 Tax=Pseudobacteroides cellulosolvens ATCC 35603 = DSM 2933 TaxID=398512 RepID=A0A0L6JQX6_9FIRM|nr:dihydrofolate reductase [Pseudobacteroides cellulosolvens]KNY28226.1 dihydrofolate reductase region [Pseudobacteroides cellulosolvens ATCC 35603 = DSM 2933]
MKAIVNVDLNWGIGCNGKLLVRIPEDMRFFKQTTLGKIVVMGRETFESLPGGLPLIDRTNIILSRNNDYNPSGVIKCSSIFDLNLKLSQYNFDDVFVIGGETVYKQLLPFCSEAYVTKVQTKFGADKFFVNLDLEDDWELIEESDAKAYNDINFRFCRYINKKIL